MYFFRKGILLKSKTRILYNMHIEVIIRCFRCFSDDKARLFFSPLHYSSFFFSVKYSLRKSFTHKLQIEDYVHPSINQWNDSFVNLEISEQWKVTIPRNLHEKYNPSNNIYCKLIIKL